MSATADLPVPWPSTVNEIAAAARRSGERIVALDDDPTGTQTVHGVTVLPAVDGVDDELLAECLRGNPVVYLLTNSRALPADRAAALSQKLGRSLAAAGRSLGAPLRVASRSDSTLRGHFPGEVDALADGLGFEPDGVLLAPAFPVGGRITVDDGHWLLLDGRMVPVAETEYARDASFGYTSSDLREWVREKTGGRTAAADVASLPLREIREGGPEYVAERLRALSGGRVCVVNAVTDADLETVARGVQLAEEAGKRFLYRCGAAFVRARAGISLRPPLEASELQLADGPGGLVVCGSHVPLTNRQLASAQILASVEPIELDVDALLDGAAEGEVNGAAAHARATIAAGRTPLVFTSRRVVLGADPLATSQSVSAALVELVRRIGPDLRYVLAKGGITSSDVATEALAMSSATVIGQLVPGVSVWRPSDGPYADVPYIVFPGNVGDDDALRTAILRLSGQAATASPSAP